MDVRLRISVFLTVFLCIAYAQNITDTPKNETQSSDSDDVTQNTEDDCWSDFNTTCLQNLSVKVIEDLWSKNEIRFSEYVTIEKTSNDTCDNESESGRASNVAWIDRTKLEQVMINVGRFLSSRALKINILDIVSLRIARSQEHPDNIEIAIAKVGEEEGKSNRMTKVLVPLIFGFKTAGAIALSITAVKLIIFKALAVSKLALLIASIILLRKILVAMGVQHHTYLYNTHSIPHHHDYQQQHPTYKYNYDGGGAAAPSAYAYNSPYYGHSAVAASETNSMHASPYGGQYDGQYDSQYLGHYPVSAAAAGLTGSEADLQAHYSNHAAVQAGPGKNKSISARSDDESKKPPLYNLVNSNAHRVPIYTYKKLVSTGRKL